MTGTKHLISIFSDQSFDFNHRELELVGGSAWMGAEFVDIILRIAAEFNVINCKRQPTVGIFRINFGNHLDNLLDLKNCGDAKRKVELWIDPFAAKNLPNIKSFVIPLPVNYCTDNRLGLKTNHFVLLNIIVSTHKVFLFESLECEPDEPGYKPYLESIERV